MKHLYLSLLLCCTTSMCIGQHIDYRDNGKKYKTKWLDKIGDEELVRSWYNYVVTKKSDKEYILRVFFPETRVLTHYMMFEDENLTKKQGDYLEYTDNGKPLKQGHYSNNLANSEWKLYHSDSDIIKEQGDFYRDERNGSWNEYDDKGRLAEKCTYTRGTKEGAFVQYDTLGSIINTGEYRSDTIFSQTNNESEAMVEKVVEVLPYLKKVEHITDPDLRHQASDKELLSHLYNLKYPRSARKLGISGRATAEFTIAKDGSVVDLKIIRGFSRDIKKSILDLVETMPTWRPGLQGGKPVKVRYILPINFTLN